MTCCCHAACYKTEPVPSITAGGGSGVISEAGGESLEERRRTHAQDRPCPRTEQGLAGAPVSSQEGIGFPAVLLYFPH